MLAFVGVAVFADAIATYDPLTTNARASLAPPGDKHTLGADFMGRDVLARIIYGARISLAVGIGATVLGCLIGMAIGLLSGFFGGWFDLLVQRLMDIMQSLPLLVMALVMAASLGPSLTNTIIAIAIPLVPNVARIIRSNTLSLREMPFVEAARAVGMSETRIAVSHVLPNTLAPLIVLATAQLGSAILVEVGARLPGARRAGAASLLGPHAVGVGCRVRAHRAVARHLPRHRHQRRGVRHQPAGRRHPRHPRPTAAVLDAATGRPARDRGARCGRGRARARGRRTSRPTSTPAAGW